MHESATVISKLVYSTFASEPDRCGKIFCCYHKQHRQKHTSNILFHSTSTRKTCRKSNVFVFFPVFVQFSSNFVMKCLFCGDTNDRMLLMWKSLISNLINMHVGEQRMRVILKREQEQNKLRKKNCRNVFKYK